MVSADSKSRLYGYTNPTLTASYTGFVNGETLATSGVTGQPVLTTTGMQYSAVGNYPIHITQGTLAASNYTFMFSDGTLTIYLGGIIGLNGVTISGSNALVDSFNSSIAGYPTSQSNQASLLSNSTITLQGARMGGDLISGTGNVILQANSLVTGDVVYSTTLSNQGTVQGTIYHQASTPFSAPLPGACGNYTAAPTNANRWITGTYSYNANTGDLNVSGNNTVTLANGTYCFHNVTASGGSTLRVTGPVRISVTGTFNASGGSMVNTTNIPSNLQISSSYTGNNGVTLSGGSGAYLTVYAPGTGITVSGGSPLFGALVGKTLTVSGNSMIHYDLALPGWNL